MRGWIFVLHFGSVVLVWFVFWCLSQNRNTVKLFTHYAIVVVIEGKKKATQQTERSRSCPFSLLPCWMDASFLKKKRTS